MRTTPQNLRGTMQPSEMETMLRVNREAIVASLMDVRSILRTTDEDDADVRLVVYGPGSWSVEHGDVGYDLAHGIACGSSTVGADDDRTTVEATADDLIDDTIEAFVTAI